MAGSRNNTHWSAGYSLAPTLVADTVTMQLVDDSVQTLNVESDPEGVRAANPGSLAQGRDGTLYLKESGTDETGWVRIDPSPFGALRFIPDLGTPVVIVDNQLIVSGLASRGVRTLSSTEPNEIIIQVDHADADQVGVASFNLTNFTTTFGDVVPNPITLNFGAGLSGSATTNLGGELDIELTGTVPIEFVPDIGDPIVAVGGQVLIQGDPDSGVHTINNVTPNQLNIYVNNATDTQKGVASFNAVAFTVTAGDVIDNPITVTLGTGLNGSSSTSLGGFLEINLSTGVALDYTTDDGVASPSSSNLNIFGQDTPNSSGLQFTAVGDTIFGRMFSPYALGDFAFSRSVPGGSNNLVVENLSTTASSNAIHHVAVASGAAGDPFILFTITGANTWAVGVDNSDGDTFVFAASNALGTTNVLTMDVGGTVRCVLGDFAMTRSNSGATNQIAAVNTSNTANSDVKIMAQQGGSSGGDAYFQVQKTGGTIWSHGIDVSDDDAYVFSLSAALGTNNFIKMWPVGLIDFTVTNTRVIKTASGGSVTCEVNNQSNTAASDAMMLATVAGASGGDPYSRYIVAGPVSAWAAGLDNSDSDAYVVSASQTPGTNNTIRISQEGEVNFPMTSAFLAYNAGTLTDKTGNGAAYALGTDALTEVYDQNADFNTNGTFTAPVTGRYQIGAQVKIEGTTTATGFNLQVITSNRTYRYIFSRAALAQNQAVSLNVLADMDAGDTYTCTITVSGEAGNTADVAGSAILETYMYGSLAC